MYQTQGARTLTKEIIGKYKTPVKRLAKYFNGCGSTVNIFLCPSVIPFKNNIIQGISLHST